MTTSRGRFGIRTRKYENDSTRGRVSVLNLIRSRLEFREHNIPIFHSYSVRFLLITVAQNVAYGKSLGINTNKIHGL